MVLGACKFLILVVGLALHGSCLKQPPNIIIIVADDLGWNDVSFHGSNQILTPNIDALAYNGVILKSHYVPALCSPSRAALLTGKYPTTLGMQHLVILADEPWGLPLSETLMPQHFKKHGYSTHAVGKWHLGFYQTEYTPTRRGFDTFFGYWNGYQDYYDHTMEATDGDVVKPVKGYDMRRGLEVDYSSLGKYSTDLYTEEAVSIISRHNKSEPLLLYLAHLAPHAGNSDKPYQAPDEEIAKHLHIDDPERRVYAAMVSRMDAGVGRVMTALRETNLLDNSIVLFISDNGAVTFGRHSNHGSNYPLRGMKESPWEGGVRGVAAVWSPLLNHTQRVSNEVIHNSDWLPTLYSAAGFDVSELGAIDGKNMWDVLSNDVPSPRTEVFINYDQVDQYSALRIGEWKYVAGTTQDGEVDDWFGDSGEDAVELGYDVSSVLQSKTNIALTGLLTDKQLWSYGTEKAKKVGKILNRSVMLKLREQSTIHCDVSQNLPAETTNRLKRDESTLTSFLQTVEDIDIQKFNNLTLGSLVCKPLERPCIFNVEVDPCERFNLASMFPEVVELMDKRLTELKKTVAAPLNAPGDPSGYPTLHNDIWVSWKDPPTTENPSQSDSTIGYCA